MTVGAPATAVNIIRILVRTGVMELKQIDVLDFLKLDGPSTLSCNAQKAPVPLIEISMIRFPLFIDFTAILTI